MFFIFKYNYYNNVVCVLGNHDYYLLSKNQSKKYFDNSFNKVKELRELLNSIDGVDCLDGTIVEIDGIKIGGCDSWYSNAYLKANYPNKSFTQSEINYQWKASINDAKYLKSIANYDDIYKIEISKLEAVYQKCDIMITHVNPSYSHEHMSSAYKNEPSNTFFSFDGHKYLNNGSFEDLQKLLNYKWDQNKLKNLQKDSKIIVFLGNKDKILNIQHTKRFWSKFADVYILNNKGHILQ